MRLDDYEVQDGKRVWLSAQEIEMVIDEAQNSKQYMVFTLAGKAGLRRSELASVTRPDFIHGPRNFVRVWEDYAKRDKYREAPLPQGFQDYVEGATEDLDPDEPVIQASGQSAYRWLKHAAQRLHAKTGDEGWSNLKLHDLRRSWGGHLFWNCGVMPGVLMDWGGWEDWKTFKETYMGEMTPEARDREWAKITYEDVSGQEPQNPWEAPSDRYPVQQH